MNQQGQPLALNAIHVPPAPSWWPPAPGWWLLAALALLPLAFGCWRIARRRWRRRRWAALFDGTIASADTPVAQVAAMSELLRRAARQVAPHAEALAGDEWLRFLDRGLQQPVFAAGAGALLRDGGYRRALSDAEVEALRIVSRARFLDWMSKR
jgi:hypothetical protein